MIDTKKRIELTNHTRDRIKQFNLNVDDVISGLYIASLEPPSINRLMYKIQSKKKDVSDEIKFEYYRLDDIRYTVKKIDNGYLIVTITKI